MAKEKLIIIDDINIEPTAEEKLIIELIRDKTKLLKQVEELKFELLKKNPLPINSKCNFDISHKPFNPPTILEVQEIQFESIDDEYYEDQGFWNEMKE